MAETTGIGWTDSTFNQWLGCSPVSPGCDRCYAEALDHRTGGAHWGPHARPRMMSEDNWKKPLRWERNHEEFEATHGHRRRVFAGSMCDWADKNAPEGQRDRLWDHIRATPHLDWQLLTKRAPNIVKYLPSDWGEGYDNVWLGVTVENRKHGLPRLERLRDIPAKVRFLSVEPLLEDLGEMDLTNIDWVIVGGESGPGFRPMEVEWVETIRQQCEAQDVAFFFKQHGGYRPGKGATLLNGKEYKQWPITLAA
ncbi:phage Gp37/Gp68 family protein [Paraburkholderia aspalathi]|nr:phage Gp37/Gp68 family protein [Paraburkholderia aspalathi]MBK3779849.1 phage Gp37/Gp68 family protein [Paraburkholderia aspalathi]